jgi:hypothetical protein
MEPSDEERLPDDVRAKAVCSGREYGWRRKDIFEAIEGARRVGLASLGGQVQLVFPDGTCELYWLNYDPTDRRVDENWRDYAQRSCLETATALHRLLETTDIVSEARKSFTLVRTKERTGTNLDDHVLFVCYFTDGNREAA